jgi:hypothetical protein
MLTQHNRFNIPSQAPPIETEDGQEVEPDETSVGSIFLLLEENKAALGLEFYSVSVSTLDEVFLRVVGKHGVREENIEAPKGKWREFFRKYWWLGLFFL